MKRPWMVGVIVLSFLAGCGAPLPVSEESALPVEVISSQMQSTEQRDAPKDGALIPDELTEEQVIQYSLTTMEQKSLDDLSGASFYDIFLEIPASLKRFHGHQVVRFTNREDVALDEVYLRLFTNANGGNTTLSNVQVMGTAVNPKYAAGNTAVRIDFPVALVPGSTAVLELDFDGDIPFEMGGNYGLFGYFNHVLVMDGFYPVIPVYDEAGWHAETPAMNGDLTFLDASFYVVRVEAPLELVIATSGSLIQREETDTLQRLVFMAGPARDFYLAGSAGYQVVSQDIGEITVNSYALEGSEEAAYAALDVAVQSLEIFSRRFGAYPYKEMDVISSPMQALGMEYPGIVGISLDLYDFNQSVFGAPASVMQEYTVVHEVAHQWFYNIVGNDQDGEPWVDEALAQYAVALYFQERYGPKSAESVRASWYDRWNRANYEAVPIGMPSAAYEISQYSPIVYGRGPIFYYQLAQILGEDALDGALKDYCLSNWWGIGNGAEIRQSLEASCDCDLSTQFHEWVYAAEPAN